MFEQKDFLSEFSIPTYEDWKKAAIETLKGAPFEKKLITKTYENVDLQPLYTKEDRDKVGYIADSLPGSFPYSRGTSALGYKGKSWDITQAFSYPTPTQLNEALKSDLERGQNAIAISVCNCRAMFENFYVENPQWDDYVCPNVQINDIKDFEDLFDGIDITKHPIRFFWPCPVPYSLEIATLFIAYCEKHNIKKSDLKVNFGFDLSPSFIHGRLYNSLETLLDDMAALVKLANDSGENFSAIAINGVAYHNCGASAVQGLGISMATAVWYIKELLNRGLHIDEIAKNIHFNVAIGSRFFSELSKLRAARVVWAKIIKEFGGNEESRKMAGCHAFTSRINKTKFDPYVNILRGTTEGLAAVLAGASSLHIGTFDEELGTPMQMRMPSEFSRRIARNVQNILKDEAHILDTIDPAGGSYYIETLTDQFITRIWEIFREIEKAGGIFQSLKDGKIQADIEATVAKRKENIAFRRDVILGTNKYPNLNEKPVDGLLTVDKEVPKKHIAEVKARKKSVDVASVWSADWKDRAAKMIEAYKNGAIIADIWLAKKQEDIEVCKPIPAFRNAELFEGLRFASEDYKAKTGKAPEIYFECFGLLKQYKARADFSTDFFAVAGFDIKQGAGFMTADDAIKNIKDITAPVVVVCSTDEIYAEVVPVYVSELRKQKPTVKIILAGLPAENIDTFKQAGVDEFIHIKSNVYETLAKLLKDIGVM